MTITCCKVNGRLVSFNDGNLAALHAWLGDDLRRLGASSDVFERLGQMFDLAAKAEHIMPPATDKEIEAWDHD